MKKRLLLIFSFALLLLLFGCAKKDDAPAEVPKIEEISFPPGAASELEMSAGETRRDYVKIAGNDDFSPGDVVFVSSDDSVSIEYEKTVLKNYVYYTINARSAGEASVYVMTSDGKIKSGEIKIKVSDNENTQDEEVKNFILNTKSKKYHTESCSATVRIKESNRELFSGTEKELAEMGYEPCGICCK